MDLRLGGDVDALRRLIEQQHADSAREPFRQDDLLLVAAGERGDAQVRAGADGYRAAPSARRRAGRRPRGRSSRRAAGDRAIGSRILSRTDWFMTRPSRRSPGTMPMPAAMADGRRGQRRALTRADARRRPPPHAEQAAQHAVGAAAEQAGEADDLARPHAHGIDARRPLPAARRPARPRSPRPPPSRGRSSRARDPRR